MKCRKCHVEIPENSRLCPRCGVTQALSQRPKNRGNGQGSAYQRANGTWMAVRVTDYVVGADGRTHRKTVSKSGFRTKKEALEYIPFLTSSEPKQKKKELTFHQLNRPLSSRQVKKEKLCHEGLVPVSKGSQTL